MSENSAPPALASAPDPDLDPQFQEAMAVFTRIAVALEKIAGGSAHSLTAAGPAIADAPPHAQQVATAPHRHAELQRGNR